MNWEALGASGEVLGALIVIVSVIYLAQQVRQNTATVRADVLRTMSIEMANQYETFGSSERSSALLYRVINEGARRADFNVTDMYSISLLLLSRVFVYDAAYRSYREGILRESEFLPMMHSRICTLPFLIESWPIHKMELSPDFVVYIEGQFESLKNATLQ